jgi:hypothetical protein
MTEEVIAQPIKKKLELEVEFDTTTKETKPSRFESLLEFADVIDAYRIFPRAFIATYLYLLIETTQWFMSIPEPNASQAGLDLCRSRCGCCVVRSIHLYGFCA